MGADCSVAPRRSQFLAALTSVVAVASALGCGADCQRITTRRTTLIGKAATPTDSPHVRVYLPMRYANDRIASSLAAAPVELPVLPESIGPLRLSRLALKARAAAVHLRPGRAGYLELDTLVEIADSRTAWLAFSVVAEVKPKVEMRNGHRWLVVRAGLGNLKQLKPRLPRSPLGNLVRVLRRRIAEAVPTPVPVAVVRGAARRLLRDLTGDVWERVRGPLFGRVAKRAVVELRLPDLPIDRFEIHSRRAPDDALVIDLVTTLPGAVGFAKGSVTGPSPVVIVSAPAAMALANWAVETGRAPQRYSRDLKPEVDGAYRPHYVWNRGDERPLKVHIFREGGDCSYIRVALEPRLKIADGQLVVELLNRTVEEADGPLVLEIGVAVSNLLGVGLDKSRKVAADLDFQVAGQGVSLAVTEAKLRGGDFEFRLEADVARPSALGRRFEATYGGEPSSRDTASTASTE